MNQRDHKVERACFSREGRRRIFGKMTAGAAAATLLAGGAGVFGIAAAAQADAADQPFDAAHSYVFVGTGTNGTTLSQLVADSVGGSSSFVEIATAQVNYNAIAYNTADNYLYGIVGVQNGSDIPIGALIRIGSDGTVTQIGTSVYQYGDGGANYGAFGSDGYLYVGNTGYSNVFVIDVTTGDTVKVLDLGASVPRFEDWAYADGYFWAVAESGKFVRVDPENGDIATFDSSIEGGQVYGASWTYPNGDFGFSRNGDGKVYQVAITDPSSATPSFTIVSTSTGPSSSNNDGAASPGLPADLAITKSASPTSIAAGDTVTYTLTVKNNGAGDSTGYTVTDVVPSGLTSVSTSSDECSVDERTVTCVGGELDSGESASFTVTATVPSAGLSDSVENTATVEGGPNDLPDPDTGNNASTASISPVSPSPTSSATVSPLATSTATPEATESVSPVGSSSSEAIPLADTSADSSALGGVFAATCALLVGLSGVIIAWVLRRRRA